MSTERPNWLSAIRVVGFDLDQTLYPKSPSIDEKIQEYLYQKIAEHAQVSLKKATRLFKERYRDGAGMSGGETLKHLGLTDGSALVQEALEHANIAALLTPDAEVNRMLGVMRSRYEGMDLITGSDISQTRKKLAALGLSTETFTTVITADMASKASGDSYRLWLARYPHLIPQQFFYIGDRVRSDHEVPSLLGIHTCLVYTSKPDPSISALQLETFSALRSLLL